MTTINIFKHANNVFTAHDGDVVFEQGATGDVMYAVVDGVVDVVANGVVVESVGPGGIIGEMALVDDGPRSAGAVARGDATLRAGRSPSVHVPRAGAPDVRAERHGGDGRAPAPGRTKRASAERPQPPFGHDPPPRRRGSGHKRVVFRRRA